MLKQFQNKFSQIFYSRIKYILPKNKNSSSILVNSFPKSGTHLLYQLFWESDYTNDFKSFIVSHPSRSKSENLINQTNSYIDNLLNGELIRGHIFYDKSTSELIKNKNIINYFIYRDPRDVVISEANYLYNMNKFHILHKHYKKITNNDDRIKFSIMGNDFLDTGFTYKNINDRFLDYKGWLSDINCFSVRYEDLINFNKNKTISNILNFYIKSSKSKQSLSQILNKSIESINPSKSHTFSTGGTAKWKKIFNDEHKELFKKYAGDLLIELKYEENYDW
ncbi:MAG: hypothetical protein CL869_00710 [Cytophagia bacterium]|nr:hypothetical protein [Cytophagia bacterium]